MGLVPIGGTKADMKDDAIVSLQAMLSWGVLYRLFSTISSTFTAEEAQREYALIEFLKKASFLHLSPVF